MPGANFVVDDWGIENSLVLLTNGDISVTAADSHPQFADAIWIGHTPEFEQRPQVTETIAAAARAVGFEKQIIQTVPDRNGRAVFEIFRFVLAPN